MPDRYIILSRNPARHKTVADAMREKERLEAQHPDRGFKILRIKTSLHSDGMFGRLADVIESIARFSPAGADPEDHAATLNSLIDQARRLNEEIMSRDYVRRAAFAQRQEQQQQADQRRDEAA